MIFQKTVLPHILANTLFSPRKEMNAMRKEVRLKVKFLRSQYESRLNREADAFRTRINYKVKAIEKLHKECGCAHRCCLDVIM